MTTTSITTTAPMSSVRVETPPGIRATKTPRIPFSTAETPVDYKDCFDSELVIRGFKFGYKAWKIKGKAQDDWQSLRGALQTYLVDNKPKILERLPFGYRAHLWSPYKLDCYLVGQRQTYALPRVAVCCGEENYAKAIRICIIESGLLGSGSHPHFSACFVIVAHVSQYMNRDVGIVRIGGLGYDYYDESLEENLEKIEKIERGEKGQRIDALQRLRESIIGSRRQYDMKEKRPMEERADKLNDKLGQGHLIDRNPLVSLPTHQTRHSISKQQEQHLQIQYTAHSPKEKTTGSPSLSQNLTYAEGVLDPSIDLSERGNLEKDNKDQWRTKEKGWSHYDFSQIQARGTYDIYAAYKKDAKISFVGGSLCFPGPVLRRATIGGLVQIGDSIFAMTVFHSLREDLEIPPPTTNSSEAFILDWEDLGFPTSESLPESADILSSSETLVYSDLSYPLSPLVSEPPKLPVFSDLYWRCDATLATHGTETDLETGLDWALLSISEDDCGPGLLNNSYDAQNIPFDTHSITYGDAAELASIILTTAHGTLVAVGASSTSSIKVPGLKTFQDVWSIQSKGVLAGDCGSWAFEESTKHLVGMVIAASPALNEVYILPMTTIFQDIKEQFGETPSLQIKGRS